MITYEGCEMQVWTPPKQRYQVPKVRPIAPRLHTAPSGNTNATEHHFLSPLWFSLSIHDIGSFIQKVQKKKLAFEKLLL